MGIPDLFLSMNKAYLAGSRPYAQNIIINAKTRSV